MAKLYNRPLIVELNKKNRPQVAKMQNRPPVTKLLNRPLVSKIQN